MSESAPPEGTAPAPKKSPLQLLKERQAQQRQNLAAKGRGSTPAAPAAETANAGPISQKKMRSSASKQGG